MQARLAEGVVARVDEETRHVLVRWALIANNDVAILTAKESIVFAFHLFPINDLFDQAKAADQITELAASSIESLAWRKPKQTISDVQLGQPICHCQ